jgi:hypothetical protein
MWPIDSVRMRSFEKCSHHTSFFYQVTIPLNLMCPEDDGSTLWFSNSQKVVHALIIVFSFNKVLLWSSLKSHCRNIHADSGTMWENYVLLMLLVCKSCDQMVIVPTAHDI